MKSLQAFLSHLIDYAGLFPPAALPLPEAIANYGPIPSPSWDAAAGTATISWLVSRPTWTP
jgi:hypothetical protein